MSNKAEEGGNSEKANRKPSQEVLLESGELRGVRHLLKPEKFPHLPAVPKRDQQNTVIHVAEYLLQHQTLQERRRRIFPQPSGIPVKRQLEPGRDQ